MGVEDVWEVEGLCLEKRMVRNKHYRCDITQCILGSCQVLREWTLKFLDGY